MQVEVIAAAELDKEVLRNLMQLYIHDLSEAEGFDVDPHGRFWYRWLDHYWTQEGRHPYLVRVDGKWAGFVLVREHSSDGRHSIAEFFVMRKYRRLGVGTRVADQTLRSLPGKWEVHQAERNVTAQAFWRGVIAQVTGGAYEEVDGGEARPGPIQLFEVTH
jgi:predicted acetyltransferase